MKIAYLGGMGVVEPTKEVAAAMQNAIQVLKTQGVQVDTLKFDFMNWNPVVSVPAGISSQGMPIGMQIVGKPHDTQTALQVAYAYSKGGPKLYMGKLFPKTE